MTTTWHVHDDLLAAYVAGRLDAIVGASVEQHVARCAECRASTTPLVDPLLLEPRLGRRSATPSSPPPSPCPSGWPDAAGSRSPRPCCSPPPPRCVRRGWSGRSSR